MLNEDKTYTFTPDDFSWLDELFAEDSEEERQPENKHSRTFERIFNSSGWSPEAHHKLINKD